MSKSVTFVAPDTRPTQNRVVVPLKFLWVWDVFWLRRLVTELKPLTWTHKLRQKVRDCVRLALIPIAIQVDMTDAPRFFRVVVRPI